MSKSNKYKISYRLEKSGPFEFNSTFRLYFYIKKLKLRLIYEPNKYMLVGEYNYPLSNRNKILNNFLIEPTLLILIKSDDILNKQLGFEILNNRLNERTR